MGGLKIIRDPPKEETGIMKADRRLCITKDGKRIVEQGDPDAAFLWAPEGRPISNEEAKQFGLTEKGGKIQLKAAAKLEDKAIPRPEDKAIKKPEKKAKAPDAE